MWDEGVKGNWSRAAEGVMFEIKERREQHPRTSFTAVESAVDGFGPSDRSQAATSLPQVRGTQCAHPPTTINHTDSPAGNYSAGLVDVRIVDAAYIQVIVGAVEKPPPSH